MSLCDPLPSRACATTCPQLAKTDVPSPAIIRPPAGIGDHQRCNLDRPPPRAHGTLVRGRQPAQHASSSEIVKLCASMIVAVAPFGASVSKRSAKGTVTRLGVNRLGGLKIDAGATAMNSRRRILSPHADRYPIAVWTALERTCRTVVSRP
jgi:hypothetical protein